MTWTIVPMMDVSNVKMDITCLELSATSVSRLALSVTALHLVQSATRDGMELHAKMNVEENVSLA